MPRLHHDPWPLAVWTRRIALCLAVTLALTPAGRAEPERREEAGASHAEVRQPDHTKAAAHRMTVKRAEVKAAVRKAAANRPKGRVWCVPFARAVSGVDIRGNAKTWWDKAAGRYARGKQPVVGAVMAFSASGAMPKGHVAVVSGVVDRRRILIDQANWERDRITEDTLVVDVSPRNDWSQVRVQNGAGSLGRVNPVTGFIYN